jgi:hypothetical protein
MATMNTIFLVLFFVALVTKEALATQHVVGGGQGWDESTDFNSWTSGQTFKVSDQLGRFLILNQANYDLFLLCKAN